MIQYIPFLTNNYRLFNYILIDIIIYRKNISINVTNSLIKSANPDIIFLNDTEMKGMISLKNILIIGAGPAGISASLYLARSGKANVTVSYYAESVLTKAEKIENYFGFAEPVSGRELIDRGIAGAKRLGVNFVQEEIVGLGINPEMKFEASTPKGVQVYDYVIIATGTSRKTLPIKGLREFEGKGVSYCAVCDGFFYRGKPVAVIGNGEYAVHEAEVLKNTSQQVTILTNGSKMSAPLPEGIAVINKKISEISGEKTVGSVCFEDGTAENFSGIFVAAGNAGSVDLARKVGAAVDGNRITIDENMMTTGPGLYAAGDCTGGIMQISTAVGEGATAALAIIRNLSK